MAIFFAGCTSSNKMVSKAPISNQFLALERILFERKTFEIFNHIYIKNPILGMAQKRSTSWIPSSCHHVGDFEKITTSIRDDNHAISHFACASFILFKKLRGVQRISKNYVKILQHILHYHTGTSPFEWDE